MTDVADPIPQNEMSTLVGDRLAVIDTLLEKLQQAGDAVRRGVLRKDLVKP